jgi:hypothetical protein
MDTLLVVVAVVALALAALLSVVSWKLLRDSRERSAARVAALESLALAEDAEPEPTWHAAMAGEDDGWDLALRRPAEVEPEPERAELEAEFEPELEPEFELKFEPAAAAAAVRRAAPERRYAAVPVSDAMFEAVEERGAPRRRWAVLAAVGVVVAASAGTAYGLRASDALAHLPLPSFGAGTGGAAQSEPLQLLSLRHVVDPSGAFTVTGLVQNPADARQVAGIAAVVYLFDRQGRYFATGRASLDSATLAPGAESPFTVVVPEAAVVGRYRVGFRREDGGVAAHVDRRGQEPAGTTGDAVDEATPTAASAASRRGRVEGD